MSGPALPDFSKFLETEDSTHLPDLTGSAAVPKPGDSQLPDFNSFLGPQTDAQRRVDAVHRVKQKFYDDIGLKPGALRGVVDILGGSIEKLAGLDYDTVKAGVLGAEEDARQFGEQFKEHPIDATVGLAKGMVEGVIAPFIQKPMELLVNEQLDLSDTIVWKDGRLTAGKPQLTPEEREDMARSIGANALAWVVGAKAAGAVDEALVGQRAIIGAKGLKRVEAAATAARAAATDAEAMAIKSSAWADVPADVMWKMRDGVLPKGVRAGIAGPVAGAVGGFTAGFVEGRDSKEALQGGLAYAVMAMPIGMFMEGAGAIRKLGKPVGDVSAAVAYDASQMWIAKQLQFASSQPLGEMLFNLNNLAEGQSLAASLAVRQIEYRVAGKDKAGMDIQYGANAVVVPTDNPIELQKLIAERASDADNSVVSAVHTRGDGIHEVLVAPGDTPQAELDFFSKAGFVHGQQVGYRGSNNWVIEEARPRVGRGPRSYDMELRNLVTDERVKGVKRADLTRLNSDAPGDLRVHLGRLITPADVYDPAQGFTQDGPNTIGPPSDTMESITAQARYTTESYVGEELQPVYKDFPPEKAARIAELRSQDSLNDAEWAEYDRLNDELDANRGEVIGLSYKGEPLKPGVNKLEYDHGDRKSGAIIYMGGAVEKVPGPNGTTVEVTVGKPGQAIGYMTWNEVPNSSDVSPRMLRGSTNFFSAADAPNRQAGTRRIIEAAAELGLDTSNSSLSQGGARSFSMRRNFYRRSRTDPSRLTVYTDKALETHILEDFLDFVGATPDSRFTLSPAENLRYTGWSRVRNSIIGRPGEALETIRGRTSQWSVAGISDDPNPRTFTESKQPYTLAEATRLLQEQVRSDAVPTVRTTADRAIDRTEMTWNDILQGYMAARGVKPEIAPQLSQWLSKKIGNELLGKESIRARLSDHTSIPILEEMAQRVERSMQKLVKIEDEGSLLPSQQRELEGMRDQVQTIRDRIDQIKRNDPLPFSDEERSVYTRLVAEAEKERQAYHDQAAADAKSFAMLATEHGYGIEREGSLIRLRDMETNARLAQKFTSADEAIQFMKEGGPSKAIDVDGGGNNLIPPEAAAGPAMLPPEPQPKLYEVPHEFAPNSRVTKMSAAFDMGVPWFTVKRAFMTAVDTFHKTKLYEQVYLPLQTAKMRLEALKRPFMEQVKEIDDMLRGAKLPREAWKRISEYRESMSPKEVIESYLKDRKLTQDEQAYAVTLANDDIDLVSVYGYTRAVGELQKGFTAELNALQTKLNEIQDPLILNELRQQLNDLHAQHKTDLDGARIAFNIDEKHLAAHKMFLDIKKRDINEVSLDAVTRLARAIMGNEPSRGEYALKNKMSAVEIAAAKKIDGVYSAVAQNLGIDERITNYLNHFRQYTELPDATPARLRDRVLRGAAGELPALAQEMIRSGEMNVYEMDPINALVQYINSGFADRHFNPVWKDAQNAAVENLKQIPRGREAVAKVLNEYIGGMRGHGAASDELAEAAFGRVLDALDVKVRPELRKDLVNTWLAAQSGAFLGFRVAQGLRDFTQFSKIYYARFGASRFARGLNLALSRDANGMTRMQSLALEGKIPGLSVLQFATDEELANGVTGKAGGMIRDAIFRASEAGLKVSAQHNSYSLAHAIAYLDTHSLATETLTKLLRGEITKEIAYKRLHMNSYDIPVAEGFDALVKDGKMDAAAEYLAQSTGTETAFIFGMQNHPYLWGTTFGRLAGSLGTWSMWDRNYLTRLAGRGTPGERAASMARLGAGEMATFLAGRTLGFNMRSWYLIPGMLFAGGPAFAYAQQIQDAMGAAGKAREETAKRQLFRAPPGQIPIISQVTPGSMAFSDYVQAWQLNKDRYGAVPVLGKAMGMSVDQTQRSFLDEMMGNYPRLRRRR